MRTSGHAVKTNAAASELRLRTRTALLGLEDRDLAEQAHCGVQRLISELRAPWQAEQVLRDLLADLGSCGASARRLRYRSALACLLAEQPCTSRHPRTCPILPHATEHNDGCKID
jgi:hypothetical protein